MAWVMDHNHLPHASQAVESRGAPPPHEIPTFLFQASDLLGPPTTSLRDEIGSSRVTAQCRRGVPWLA